MNIYYDTNLIDDIREHPDNNNLLINSKFKNWAGTIINNLRFRTGCVDDHYESPENRELLTSCQAHAEQHKTPMQADSVILLSHPFYLHLSHMVYLYKESQYQDADQYKRKLLRFLKADRDKNKVAIVAIETLHHYAAATSILLEKGYIDQVIFSWIDSIDPLHESDLGQFSGKNVYICGMYKQICVNNLIMSLRGIASPKKVSQIIDLILSSPKLFTERLMSNLGFSETSNNSNDNTISLEQLITKLGLSPLPA